MKKKQLPLSSKKRNERKKFLSVFALIFMMSLSFTFSAKAADVDIFAPTAFTALDGSDGSPGDGIFTVTGNLHIFPGGSITGPGGAFGIKIVISGDLIMDNTGSINGNQSCGNCPGITIDIKADGDVTLNSGASITSNGASFGCGNGGNITIIAGTATSGGAIFTDTGSLIQSHGCSAGAIVIKTLNLSAIVDIDGTVESRGIETGQSPHQPPGGGPITIVGGCTLIISPTGIVSSQGSDPGADLVHLEACVVDVYGIVRSFGAGHALPDSPPNHLDGLNRPDKPLHTTAGVEIWAGDSLVIDQQTPGRNGEVYTDLSGAGNSSWIDLFARGYISILGKTTACFNNPCSPTPPNTCFYAVHANNAGSGSPLMHGGAITVKSIEGAINENGRAIQTNGGFGGSGGHIVVQANLNIDLSSSLMAARGCTKTGGNIDIKSFNGDVLSDAGTSMDVTGGTTAGAVTLTECGTVAFAGTVTPGPNPTPATLACGGSPSLPCEENPDPTCSCTCTPYVILPASCGGSCCVANITVCKHVNFCDTIAFPDAPPRVYDWTFNSDIPGHGTFTITTIDNGDNTADGCITFNNIPADTYTITEVTNPDYLPSPFDTTITLGCSESGTATFTNTPITCQPEHGCQWCNKGAVLSQVWQNMNGDTCAVPDILVDVRMPHTTANNVVTLDEIHTGVPATWSINAAMLYVNTNGDPTPGDGEIFIGVTSSNCGPVPSCDLDSSRNAGGDNPHGTENVIINNLNPERLNVFGCSVTIWAANLNLPVITVQDGVGKVTVLDLHVWKSHVQGYLVKPGNADLVVIKNGAAYYNDLGYDVQDNNVQITGSQHMRFNRIGAQVSGSGVILRTNNDITNNTQDGIVISGNFNESNGNEVGTSGKPNAEGLLVSGNSNDIHDGDFNYNTTNGIRVTGNNNFFNNDDAQHNGGKGFLVTGNNNNLDRNKQTKYNGSDGIFVSGIANILNGNQSENNTGNGINADIANGASGNMLEDNTGKNNTLQGIRACGQIDLGDNDGDGNGVDPQVVFVCPLPSSAKFEVVDISADKVFKYDASFGFIASTALASANSDGNDVADNGTNTYVLDKSDKQVYRYVGGTPAASKVLKTSTAGSLNSASGIAIDNNDLWVADGGNKKLYKYSLSAAFPSGGNLNALQEIAFTNSGSVNNTNAEGLLIDATNLYVLDKGKKQFFRYPRAGGAGVASKVIKDISGGGLGNPMGATLDGTTVWVVDDNKDKAYSYSLSSLFSGSGNLNASSQFALYSTNANCTGIAVGGISNFPRLSEEDADLVLPDHDALIQIYPNPTQGNVTVQFMSTTSDQYSVSVVDMAGRVVTSYVDHAKEGMNVHEMDLRNVLPGMYMLILQNPNMKEVKRIIVQ